jgi:5,10-methylenetetrahydromethanopterin reductase
MTGALFPAERSAGAGQGRRSDAVSFGVVRPPRLTEDLVPWMRAAEDVGIELFGFGDSQTMWADPYIAMTLAAEHTSRALVGPMVTVPVTRHPTVAASAIAGIQRLSGGRAFFGIGPGDSALYNIGQQSARMADLQEYATAVRDLCATHTAQFQGRTLTLNWDTQPVPLWIAGDGPRMLELAGRVGDGVIVGNGATPDLVRYALDHIASGAASAGRSVEDLDVWFMVRVHVAPSVDAGIEDLSFYLASYANVRFRKAMHDKGVRVTPETEERLLAFRAEFAGGRAYDPADRHNVELLDKHGLRRWLADQFLLTGPLETIADQLDGLIAAGARRFAMPQMLPDPVATTRALAPLIARYR